MLKTLLKSRLKIAGLCGIAAPIITILIILITIYYSPWFRWTENALSDLGVYDNGAAAILFNSSLIFCGLFNFIFVLGLRKFLEMQSVGQVGTVCFILASIALCGIGIFPENAGIIHLYFSIAFFVLSPISLFLISIALIKMQDERKLGMVIFGLSICSAVVWLMPINGAAIPEIIASTAGGISTIFLGARLLST